MSGRTSRAVLLILIAAAVTACEDKSGGSAAPVSVPNVVGETQSAASTALTAVGLTVGAVTQASSASVASGAVISETPAAASSVAKGSAVTLVVSSGPPPVSVPNVVGDTQAAATSALTGAGLTLGTVTQSASASVASGDVISESPAAGASVANGSAVALVVSTGVQTFTIGGTVIGLKSSGTVHVLNGSDNEAISSNGPFTLPTAVAGGAAFMFRSGRQRAGPVPCRTARARSRARTSATCWCIAPTPIGRDAERQLRWRGLQHQYRYGRLSSGVPFDGAGNEGNTATLITNMWGAPSPPPPILQLGRPYTVVTTNAIPVLTTGGNNIGAIAGEDSDEFFWLADASTADGGGFPALAVGVNPLLNGPSPRSPAIGSPSGWIRGPIPRILRVC
jgi:hypothetical protein